MSAVEFDEQKVDSIFKGLDQCHLPGAVVGIAVNGKPVYRKGFGLASIESPVVLSPSTRLRIGSTSKHFTCLAFLLLCEDGRCSIDDRVDKYCPELHASAHRVTMRQLMGNTSGLRDVYDICNQFNDHYTNQGGAATRVTSADLLALYGSIDDVNAAPDTAWIYNNGGWLILGSAIERVVGQPLEEFLRQRIFEPVGMYDTLLARSEAAFLCNRGAQHVVNPSGGFERMYMGMEHCFAAGALVSTVDDMLRWLAHMDAPRVGSPVTWKLMKTPRTLANGASTNYGLGLNRGRYRGAETLFHHGNAFGGTAQMLKVPAAALDIVILINRQDTLILAESLLDACLTGLDPVQERPIDTFVTGTFRSPKTHRVMQLLPGTARPFPGIQQLVSVDGGFVMPFTSRDGSDGVSLRSRWEVWNLTLTLIGDRQSPTAITLTEFGNVDELVRVEPVRSSNVDSVVGCYRSSALRTQATIYRSDGGAGMKTMGPFGSGEFKLTNIAEGLWQAKPAGHSRAAFIGGMLSFEEYGQESFLFSNFQNRRLRFVRVPAGLSS